MRVSNIFSYLNNCFLLLIPVIAWNIAFVHLLPEAFSPEEAWKGIPGYIMAGESIMWVLVTVLPMFMPVYIFTRIQQKGLIIYLAGVLLYFLSWRPLILYPDSSWSTSLIGFTAPSLLQLVWLTGIAMVGYKWYFKARFSKWFYFIIAILFTAFQFAHAVVLYDLHY